MVTTQLAGRDIDDQRVLDAMGVVPRHQFVPASEQASAYEDHPLPIGLGQTISQPYIVAIMSQLAEVHPPCKVLEVGTGSGYQAAVLSEMGCDVWSIEIVEELAARATAALDRLGYGRIHTRAGDGYGGWPEHAPFDAVLITAAPPRIPEPLLSQLRVGGRLVAPVGDWVQELVVITRTSAGFERRNAFPVRFVPMTGEVRER
ncbi:MAG: protein-L-isoaspartate(D-aspartate) O-methyltransferase [Deltaproteobacteria bacterium]|nr:protein-L-isoaspartate(D-aspartate) O-methyltransferase [Deltaproteobacteria bacterium]